MTKYHITSAFGLWNGTQIYDTFEEAEKACENCVFDDAIVVEI